MARKNNIRRCRLFNKNLRILLAKKFASVGLPHVMANHNLAHSLYRFIDLIFVDKPLCVKEKL